MTDFKSMGKECWNQLFTIDLDRARELEVEVYYKDSRSMCAFLVIRIGDYIEPCKAHCKVLELEPQGQLFAEVRSCNNLFLQKLNFRSSIWIPLKVGSRDWSVKNVYSMLRNAI